jgi:oligoendopeptidase F
VETIPERKDIDPAHQWDLAPLFSQDSQWESLYADIEARIEGYKAYRGRLHESLDLFKEAVDFDLALSRDLERLYTYAHLRSDEDKSNQQYLALYQRAMNLYTRMAEAASFMTPEIQSIADEVMSGFLSHESMAAYRFSLEKILRFKPHTRSRDIEEILAMSGEVAQSASQTFSQLDNADLTFGAVLNEQGKNIELSHGNFSTFLMSPSRDVRKKAFRQYYQAYEKHKNTMATTLAYSNKKDCFYSRVRRFDSCRASSLFADDVPGEVYDSLIAAVKANRAPLFKYLEFRKKALGLEALHFYDTYVPIVSGIEFVMPYDEAVETCCAALKPLGDDYCSELRQGLTGGWVDRYENRGKRSGAYSSGCYDSPPYILMNYRDDNINSLYTLMHEAGHSMHSYYSKKHQPYISHDYTIFVAEVASTFNEVLLSEHLLKLYAVDPMMKAYILNREIDNIRATLYRQTMFAEFEKITHEIVENNAPLTLEVIRNRYRKLLEDYFGSTLVIDDELTLEALRIPHFYSAFYVYKYATGISAAIALARKVLAREHGARDAYLDFLKLGGSLFPIDELKVAGIDMRTPHPVEQALAHFNDLVDRFIALHDELKR